MNFYRASALAVIGLFLLNSCYSPRHVEDLEKKLDAYRTARENCEEALEISEKRKDRAIEERDEMANSIADYERAINLLEEDTLVMGRNYRRLKQANADLNETLEKQVRVNKQLANQSEQKNKELYNELLALQKKLNEKEQKLNERDKYLTNLQDELNKREAKVAELQSAIDQRDSLMSSLKNRITSALLDYENKGISVRVENDKVYISLENQILFASGKYTLDSKGEKALLDLASVLRKNDDLTIMVEGHTDNVPISTSCIKDNYDLSVMRATEITRILTKKGKVDPKRIIAAGRGEFLPVADNSTKEGRRKNRRTEIILTPDLDKLFKIINE